MPKPTIAVAVGLAVVIGLCPKGHAADKKPNVVLIITDDQGWWDLGCHGNPAIETPVMDRLSSEGVEFTRFYASPVCTPTRASLMTGRYHQRTGAISVYMGRDVLAADEITLGQVFQQQGYRTGLFGKWHLGRYMKYHPNNRGFDEFFGFWHYGYINRYFDSDELFRNRQPVTVAGYATDVLTDTAISFVRANRDRPFFLYLPYNAPHYPYLAPDPLIDKYLKKGLPLREACIYAMIDNIDQNTGRLLRAMDEENLRDNTLVIFMSDNGGVSHHYTAGLRGHKSMVYEGGIRVPIFLRWPNHFAAGVKIDTMAQHIDLFPTLCELIGAAAPNDRKIDGKSLLPIIRDGGGSSPHKYLFHQWNWGFQPKPDENWAVHNERYKLVNGELFDLQADAGEKTNIATQHPDKVRELRQAFDQWFADVTVGRDYARFPIEVGRPDENPVEIDVAWGEYGNVPVEVGPPRDKSLGNRLQYEYDQCHRDRIINWFDENEPARWKIDVVRAGQYEVQFEYGCQPGDEGSTFRISVGEAHLDGQVEARLGRLVFEPATIGRIELPKGPAMLEIRPLKIVGKELIVLHKIWLRRVS